MVQEEKPTPVAVAQVETKTEDAPVQEFASRAQNVASAPAFKPAAVPMEDYSPAPVAQAHVASPAVVEADEQSSKASAGGHAATNRAAAPAARPAPIDD